MDSHLRQGSKELDRCSSTEPSSPVILSAAKDLAVHTVKHSPSLVNLALGKRMVSMIAREELLTIAREAALRAHCPYSHFRVGAAVVAGGKIYVGVNVEISSCGLTLCAERSALAAAVSDGAGPVTQVAVACIDVPLEASVGERTPCGACRQWLADLAPDAVIYIDGVEQNFSVADLLPHAFGLHKRA